ncbi:MAG: hypothetical protein ABW004_07995 [Aeromicrobium sp.]
MKAFLAILPIVMIIGTIAAALLRRGKPVPWGQWPVMKLFGFVAFVALIGAGLFVLSGEIEPKWLQVTVALLGVLLILPVAMYVLLTGGQLPRDEQTY